MSTVCVLDAWILLSSANEIPDAFHAKLIWGICFKRARARVCVKDNEK
jgi:hypothetical protein